MAKKLNGVFNPEGINGFVPQIITLNKFDKDAFLMDQVNEYLEVVEDQNPDGFTEEYKNNMKKFFDRMIKEYNLRVN